MRRADEKIADKPDEDDDTERRLAALTVEATAGL
jgi:hypothetical protein